MGTPRGGNGGDLPRDDSGDQSPWRDRVPGLPPEWGAIIIPDDASALDAEAAPVRRHFRRELRRARWRRRAHLRQRPARRLRTRDNGLRTPMLIMSTAVIVTLISLIAIGWPPGGARTERTGSPTGSAEPLLAITLPDAWNHPVRIGAITPAVILLVSDDAGRQFVDETATSVAAGVTVVEVTAGPVAPLSVPPAAGAPPAADLPGTVPSRIRRLFDQTRSIRAAVPGLAGGSDPSAVLVNSSGAIIRVVPTVRALTDFAADLRHLTT